MCQLINWLLRRMTKKDWNTTYSNFKKARPFQGAYAMYLLFSWLYMLFLYKFLPKVFFIPLLIIYLIFIIVWGKFTFSIQKKIMKKVVNIELPEYHKDILKWTPSVILFLGIGFMFSPGALSTLGKDFFKRMMIIDSVLYVYGVMIFISIYYHYFLKNGLNNFEISSKLIICYNSISKRLKILLFRNP